MKKDFSSNQIADTKNTEDFQSSVTDIGFGGLGPGGSASVIDTKNGKIVRIRPLHYDWKYDKKRFSPWRMEARGKTFEPRMQVLPAAFSLGYKKRVYSPNRILYPLKRVDWDPGGERNPQNRGVSKYERISWDEAVAIIVSELKRVRETYSPYAVLAQCDGHGESKLIHKTHGCNSDFLKILGGYTLQVRNTDSWEGWNWGAKHVWGMSPVGYQGPGSNLIPDIVDFAQMVLFWGCDPETTPGGQNGQGATRLCYWFSEIGIKSIYVCPDLNYGAAVHADKWIPIRPGTDAALQLAIAYLWITDGTYNKKYISTHAVGFEKFESYVLGKEDGVGKTPDWAAAKCDIPVWTIKALAREWAANVTSIAHGNGGPGIRSAYSTENARFEVLLLAMQGLGGPGVHQVKMIEWQDGSGNSQMPGAVASGMLMANTAYLKSLKATNKMSLQEANMTKPQMPKPGDKPGAEGVFPEEIMELMNLKPPKQFIPRDRIHDALLNPPISWYGIGWGKMGSEDQFIKFTYPIPKEEGGSEIHMIWTDAPCWITCWNDSNSYIKALRSPKIEFMLAQHPWMENDCLFADIILPVSTKFELNDIGADSGSGQFPVVIDEKACIDRIGESKSDYEIVCMIAEKFGLLEKFSGGQSVEEKKELVLKGSEAGKLTSYDELTEKGYFVIPADKDWKSKPVGLRSFYEDPDEHPLETPSGKIEFCSQNLEKYFPDDAERPPVPHWIEKGESHDERVSSPRAKKYPLIILSNHPRWRMHANHDDITWTREAPTGKVRGFDGYLYEPLWLNPKDAASRNIKDGDIVKVFNERGAVLGGAYISERVMPGAVSMDHGARYDPIIPGELDRGGAINTITPHNTTSKNATGMAVSSFLVEVEKVTMAQMEDWRNKYPAAFVKRYDKAAGLCFDAFIAK